MRNNINIKCHEDGKITYWDIFKHCWEKKYAFDINDNILNSFSDKEKQIVKNYVKLSEDTHNKRVKDLKKNEK